MTDEVADWSSDWVVNEFAARVDRAGPRPVSEDHKPGLVHRDLDWLINYLASISKRGSAGDVVRSTIWWTRFAIAGVAPLALSAATKSASSPIG